MDDLLLVNANVLTMDPARPRARSVAVAGGRIVALDAGPAGRPARSSTCTERPCCRGFMTRTTTWPGSA